MRWTRVLAASHSAFVPQSRVSGHSAMAVIPPGAQENFEKSRHAAPFGARALFPFDVVV